MPMLKPVKNIHGHFHGNNHRGGYKNPMYDYGYYYDLAPDIHNYELVNINKLLINTNIKKISENYNQKITLLTYIPSAFMNY